MSSEKRAHSLLVASVSAFVCLFTLLAVNFPVIQQEQSQLAIFVGLGLVLCFLTFPTHKKLQGVAIWKHFSSALAVASVICCGFVVLQMEPAFEKLWIGDKNLGNRAGAESNVDILIAVTGLFLVLEATRRSIGWIVPALALVFIAHSFYCYGVRVHGWPAMPSVLLPHRGQSVSEIASSTFLQIGVFGPAAKVMFKFVFLFVIFGALLELSGATKFIIDFSDRVFRSVTGGPAMVSVLGSALMGTLSGSAVANAVTTGSFTIPMMRKSGFKPHIAGGIMAAAASGGALVPPVMGAGAYMMAELLQMNFLDIAIAAMIPAMLYYFSILIIVYLHARQIEEPKSVAFAKTLAAMPRTIANIFKEIVLSFTRYEGIVFFAALFTLIGLLVAGKTAFRSVSASIVIIMLLATFRRELKLSLRDKLIALGTFAFVGLGYHLLFGQSLQDSIGKLSFSRALDAILGASIAGMVGMMSLACLTTVVSPFTRLTRRLVELIKWRSALRLWDQLKLGAWFDKLQGWKEPLLEAFNKSARNGVSLVAASACVGIIIGIVTSTGIAGMLSEQIAQVVESNLLLALIGIMGCSLVLGMGVPSVVCYLLMATLMGPLLEQLGVTSLAAHLFIFYFGMMSMVTPPVALAAYASATIAEAKIMQTAMAAFRFALVGFTLPYMFIYNPALLLLPQKGQAALHGGDVLWGISVAMLGISALAGGITGALKNALSLPARLALFLAAALLLVPPHLSVYNTWHTLKFSRASSTLGAKFETMIDGSLFVSGPNGEDDYLLVAPVGDFELKRVAALRIEVIPDERLPAGGSGRDEEGRFRLTEFEVEATVPEADEPQVIEFDKRPAVDFASKEEPGRDMLDKNIGTGWEVHPRVGALHQAVLEASQEFAAAETTLSIKLVQQFGDDRTIGRFRISVAERTKFGWMINLCGAFLLLIVVVLNFRQRPRTVRPTS